jgi:anti-sigma28 factor (negative regulator of flagellin synthesis)
MKLTNTSIETLSPGGAGGTGAIADGAGKDSRAAAASAAGSDSVKLSNTSQLVNLAKASAPDRAAKVASVAALLQAGQYSTDNASVSQALVAGHIR